MPQTERKIVIRKGTYGVSKNAVVYLENHQTGQSTFYRAIYKKDYKPAIQRDIFKDIQAYKEAGYEIEYKNFLDKEDQADE